MPFQTYQGQGNHFGENNSQPSTLEKVTAKPKAILEFKLNRKPMQQVVCEA